MTREKILDRFQRANRPEAIVINSPEHLPLEQFGRRYFGNYLANELSEFHRTIIKALESKERGTKTNWQAPRGAAKSSWSMISIIRDAAYGIEPFQIFIKHTATAARKDLEIVAEAFRNGSPLCKDAGVSIASANSSHVELSNGCRVEAYSVSQQIRGAKHREHRPSRIVIDDPNSSTDITSEVYRDAVISRYTREIAPAGGPDTNYVCIATPLHMDSLTSYLQRDPAWTTHITRAIEKFPVNMDLWERFRDILLTHQDPERDKHADEFYLANRAAMDEGAVVFWPDRFPLLAMMKLFFTTPKRAWGCEYDMNAMDSDAVEWDSTYFSWEGFWFGEAPTFKNKVMGVDAALNKSDDGDYSAITEVGEDLMGIRYVAARGGKMNIEKLCDEILDRVRAFEPHSIEIEENGFQSVIKLVLETKARNRGIRLPKVNGLDNTENKHARIRRLGDGLANRVYRFKSGCEKTAELVRQLQLFPGGKHDDWIDALEFCDRKLHRPKNVAMGGGSGAVIPPRW